MHRSLPKVLVTRLIMGVAKVTIWVIVTVILFLLTYLVTY